MATYSYFLGEIEAASSAKKLTVTNMGGYYLHSDSFVANLANVWDWDGTGLDWGCFSISASGNNSIVIEDSYSDNANIYGGVIQISSNSDSVTIAKSSSAIFINMNGGTIALFTAKDENGDSHKCLALARTGSTYKLYLAADDGTSANVFSVSNNNAKRTTTDVYELTPFFVETADGLVFTNEVLLVRAFPDKPVGLYKINDSQVYIGTSLGLADGTSVTPPEPTPSTPWISNYISIGNYQIPAPVSYEVQRADLDSENTTRNEAGYLVRDRIRGGVYKIIGKWRLTVSELQSFITAISSDSFSVTFLDMTTASYQTKTMYVGDRSASVVVGNSSVNDLLVDFSVDFIEF